MSEPHEAPGKDEAEGVDRLGARGNADHRHGAVEAEEREVGVEVVVGRDCVEDEVERAGVLCHRVLVLGDHDFIS